MLRTKVLPLALALSALAFQALPAKASWPLWDSYTAYFLESSGRIVDHDAEDRTTSEGQSYALFFSLVANDRPSFDRILSWTQLNLAHHDLGSNLPAWLWGNRQGNWQILDKNSASDADLWMAYSLLEAGRLWRDPTLSALGRSLANLIYDKEVFEISGLGPVLLPGPTGFKTPDGWFQLNASYLPVPLLLGLSAHTGSKSWRQMADVVPVIVEGSAPKGFVMDWIAYRPYEGFFTQPSPISPALASYDAIRVYLWAGMQAPSPGRDRILSAISPMATYLEHNPVPPASVDETGMVVDAHGGIGFSAAVIPLLVALNRTKPLAQQKEQLRSEKNDKTGLYGKKPRYYDQNLALFALGWYENRFSFDERGRLGVNWK